MRNLVKGKAGFTLVEIMIVVAIIGLLAAIALPNFIAARTTTQANTCQDQLRQINGAKEQAAFALNLGNGAIVPQANVDALLNGPMNAPLGVPGVRCPAAGPTYVLGAVGTNPTCTSGIAGHVLQ